MIILLIVLEILAIAACLVICKKYENKSDFIDGVSSHVGCVMIGVLCVTIVFMFGVFCTVVPGNYIDVKIQMYTEENKVIETRIDSLVEKYMNYESDTYKELKDDDAIALVSLYPELKADELVQKQIGVYMENNAKIKELKEEKINASISRWWLYFGK